MSFRRKKEKEQFNLDMTTCSDIIFTLLLFYILTQNFLPQTTLDLPETVSTEQTESQEQVKIEITESGNIIWNDVSCSEEQLAEQILKASVMQEKSAIMIFAHTKSPAGVCIELLDKLRNSGVKNVVFAGQSPKHKENNNK